MISLPCRWDSRAASTIRSASAPSSAVVFGAPYAVTWTAAAGAASCNVRLSIDGGVTWSTLALRLNYTTASRDVPSAIKKNITSAVIKVSVYDSNSVKLGAKK